MTENEKCLNNYVLDRLKCIKADLYEIYDVLESEAIYKQISSIEELIKLLTPKPKPERKHCYCQDCAYFADAICQDPERPLWFTCQHSRFIKGREAGKLRYVTKCTHMCREFIPLGEKIDYHEGIKDLINNIKIESEEEE